MDGVDGTDLVQTSGIAVEQHSERLFEDFDSLFLGQCLFVAFDCLAEKGLGNVCTIASCNSRRGVSCSQQIDISQEPWKHMSLDGRNWGRLKERTYVFLFSSMPPTNREFQSGFILDRLAYKTRLRYSWIWGA